MWAYLFPESKISVARDGSVKITGLLAQYHNRIAPFIRELGLAGVTIRYGNGRFFFPRALDAGIRQRLRNFILAECPQARR